MNAICSKCSTNKEIQLRSYKNNIKINGDYLCHKCKNNSATYKLKQQKSHPKSQKTPIIAICNCGYSTQINSPRHNYDYTTWVCRKCRTTAQWKNPKYRNAVISSLTGMVLSDLTKTKISASISIKWNDDDYRNSIIKHLQSEVSKQHRRKCSLTLWSDPSFADKYRTNEFRSKISKISKRLWQDEEYRKKVLAAKSTKEHKKLMANIQSSPEYKTKLAKALQNQPKVSNLQLTLYNILDDLGVSYYREYNDGPDDNQCTIGPWSFDCVVLNKPKKLLIECQGEFIHSLPGKRKSDKAKRTYWERYLSTEYDLRYIWEHQFAEFRSVETLLRYWLDINHNVVEFNFNDITIEICKASECNELMASYHYLRNTGRGGICYGAYFNNKMVAACIFSPLARQNIIIDGRKTSQCRELSRFCIKPSYQKKNFASWFISRAIKLLPKKYNTIISYSDSTYNHDGTIYKASNFTTDKTVPADYHYVSENGWVMHKKTLYNRACNLKMTESEYSDVHGYRKSFGSDKTRFIYRRKE